MTELSAHEVAMGDFLGAITKGTNCAWTSRSPNVS